MPFCRICGEQTTRFEDASYNGICINCKKKQEIKQNYVIEQKNTLDERDWSKFRNFIGIYSLFVVLVLLLTFLINPLLLSIMFLSIVIVPILAVIVFFIYYTFYVEN